MTRSAIDARPYIDKSMSMRAKPGGARAVFFIGIASLLIAALAGCGEEQGELTQWMDQQKREVRPNVQPLSAPKKFIPQAYVAMNGVEPFSTQKLTVALKQEARQPNSLLAGQLNRRKEPLEAYPLDSMAMVGSVARAGRPYALLRVDRLLYQVKAGDYLGQNYGKITQISGDGAAPA